MVVTKSAQRGFQAMSDEKRREIARKGGMSAHRKGTAYRLTFADRSKGGRLSTGNFKFRPEDAKRAGQKGGRISRRTPVVQGYHIFPQ